MDRRSVLAGAGALAGLMAMAACDTAPSGDPSAKGTKKATSLRWWDHTPNLQPANKTLFAEYEKAGGLKVDYQYYAADKLGQALTLAKQSNQLPDAFTNVGLQLPLPQLIADKWFAPIELSDEARKAIGADNLVNGVHVFDDKVYSFPIFNPRQYWAIPWFNHELVSKAGFDPEQPPKTYDEFREVLRKIKSSTPGSNGLVLNIAAAQRIGEQVSQMATAAGFKGAGGVEFATGDIRYDSDEHLQVVEFLLSLNKDGLMMPGSVQLDERIARQRWATGTVGYFFDGPWCSGTVSKDAAPFLPKVAAGPMLVPNSGMEPVSYNGPSSGMYYISGQSTIADQVSKIMNRIASAEYQVMISNAMAQPPLDMDVVAKSDAHPAYKKVVEMFKKDCFLGPTAVVGNPELSKVAGKIKPVKPGLGDIIQGAFSGQVKDVKKALTTLTSSAMKAREEAVKAVAAGGAKVSVDDYAFPKWQPRKDFTADMYG